MVAASIITLIIMLAVAIPTLYRMADTTIRGPVFLCLVLIMPMCWLMIHGVRLPFDRWLQSILDNGETLVWLRTTYAPLTEEPAKLMPLLFPFVRKAITRKNFVAIAVALGVGFAVGEVFTVGGIVRSQSPEEASLPWYFLGGFINERLMTGLIHSGMTCAALWCIVNNRGIVCGLAAAMGLHYIVNFPITMAQLGWLGPNLTVSQIILGVWITACGLVGFAFLQHSAGSKYRVGAAIFGHTVCPSCKTSYTRRLRGLNFGLSLRYEPCPNCKNWHWTKRLKPVDE